MSLLIAFALVACASAAPSDVLAPVAVAGVPTIPAVAFPAVIPTISPGDIQAAAIDAQVKAQDLAIAAADEARNLKDKIENVKETDVVVDNDQVKEKAEEAFWSAQDKQWQTLDALKTAEAQIDGAIANNAPVLAKSAVVGPYIVAPVASPIVYTPGFIAPLAKVAETEKVEDSVLVKSAEKKDEKDSAAVEANSVVKPVAVAAPLAFAPPLFSYGALQPVAIAPIVHAGW